MNTLSRYRLYLETIRHLEFSQVCHRIRRVALEQLRQVKPVVPHQAEPPAIGNFISPFRGLEQGRLSDLTSPAIQRGVKLSMRQMADGRFRFLSHEASLGKELNWNYDHGGRLWRFHLHSFEYSRHLLIASIENPQAAFALFKSLTTSWIDQNALVRRDAWHPFTVSNRIVEWILAASNFRRQIEVNRPFHAAVLSSLAGQTRFLKENLERDVGGNHLIKNLKALVWAGLFFDGPEARQWKITGVEYLKAEVEKQLLPDGGHFERNPGYHVQVLCDLLETGLCLRLNQAKCPGWLEAAIFQMTDWLKQILSRDGNLPHLKDTAPSRRGEASEVLQAAVLFCGDSMPVFRNSDEIYPSLLFGRPLCNGSQTQLKPDSQPERVSTATSAKWLPDSGYLILRDDYRNDFLILDAGKVCPETLPAHAHADLFSYELTISGTPVVVDSGVFTYEEGLWRDFFRSTRAHNTVEVMKSDQSEMWAQFRVARRARVTGAQFQETETEFRFKARHDGYRHLDPPVGHARTLIWNRFRRVWLILDHLTGTGLTEAQNLIHFHPAFHLESQSERIWRIPVRDGHCWLGFIGPGQANRQKGEESPRLQGWYSRRMGVRTPANLLSWQFSGRMPLSTGYIISLEPISQIRWNDREGQLKIEVDLESGRIDWDIAIDDTDLAP